MAEWGQTGTDSNYGTQKEPSAPAEVPSQSGLLSDLAERLESRADSLTARLASVLGQDSPMNAVEPEPMEPAAPLADDLWKTAQRLRQVERSLAAILRRLEL